jgi:chromosome segregation ATPase
MIDELKESILKQLTPQLEKTNELLRNQLTEMIDKIKEMLIQQFGKTFAEFNESTQAIKKWQEDHRQHVEQLTEAFNTAATGIREIRNECENIPLAMGSLKSLMGELDERVKAFAEMKKSAEESFPIIKRHLDQIGGDLQQSAAGFTGLKDTITATYTQASELAKQHQAEISRQIIRITAKVTESADAMTKQSEQATRNVLESLQTTTENIISENQNAATQQRESLAQIVTAVQKATDDCATDTKRALEQMATDNAQQVSDAMAEIAKKWGEQQIGIAEKLSEIIRRIET